MKDGFASAQRAYDNLTPEDFGPGFSERECDRCSTPRLADELQYDEVHDLLVCGGCLAYGEHSAIDDEWRRTCSDCGELFGASEVTGKEGDDKLCKGCRRDREIEAMPFNEVHKLLEKIAHGPERWRSQVRAGLEIEATDTKGSWGRLDSCPIRRSVYASLLVFALAAEERYQAKVEAEYNASK